ncbi:hypothetical protein Q4489_03770 [Thalassotalea sp. 1_MG-2023]|uniref:hypothetical protein n=1 Tax=Thalassotalea sp. 1_MG-2023 TaxID=3062680 RepID=UPI0026E42CE0|nr:hypothetical protein [Thalassotalea sp. 1_MG-2023]MDO6426113.1 hypothetical protein [Thalassotalea sp. 1_MG-2023]
MIDTSTNITTKLIGYEKLYASFEPTNKTSLAFRVHNLVGLLISAHFSQASELGDLINLVHQFGGFLRELKAEFDLIYSDLGAHSYPAFVQKLAGAKYGGAFGEYHNLVIDTLKLLLFRIEADANPAELEDALDHFLRASIERYNPKNKPIVRFGQSVKTSSEIGLEKRLCTPAEKVQEYVQRQIDIALEN